MERQETKPRKVGIPQVELCDERTLLGDGRYLILFEAMIAWPDDTEPDGGPERNEIESVGT